MFSLGVNNLQTEQEQILIGFLQCAARNVPHSFIIILPGSSSQTALWSHFPDEGQTWPVICPRVCSAVNG